MFAFALEVGVVAHDGAHVGFDMACGDEGLGADDLLRFVVDSVEEYGELGFECDEVESAFPPRCVRAGAFGGYGKGKVCGTYGALCELIGEAGVATALYGDASESAKQGAEWPKEPFALHEKLGGESDGGVIEFAYEEIPIAGVWCYADDALGRGGLVDMDGPSHPVME